MKHEIIVDHLGLPDDHRALIREACDESEHIFIAPMDKGLSGSTVWQARWRVRGTSQLSALHVLKIGTRSKLEAEERNIQNYVSVIDSVPNVVLYPRNAYTEKPRDEVALLRQRFAGDATGRTVSLRQFIQTESRCPNVESAVKVLERLYSGRISRWHGQQSISDAADTESTLSWKSLGAELASWFRKIDLQAAADQIGTSALDASLRRLSGRSLDNVIGAVDQVSQRRFQKPIGIVHGDLHAQNVNVDSSGRLHLIDFGSTGIGWRAADFLMMECSLRFTSSPPNALLDHLLAMDDVVDRQWYSTTLESCQGLETLCYGQDLSKIAAASCVVRRYAQQFHVVASPEEYRMGLVLLTAAMASYPTLVNRLYVFHSLAKQLDMLEEPERCPRSISTATPTRAVAIFGVPGSGKTTLARHLRQKFGTAIVLEAFPDIIAPVLALANELDDLDVLLDRIRHSERSKLASLDNAHNRQQSREIFARLSEKYGREWVSRTTEAWRRSTYPDRLVIVAGLRGRENARFLASQGWLVIFLSGDMTTIAARHTERDRITLDAALAEQVEEERLYRTTEIAAYADVNIDVITTGEADMTSVVIERIQFAECIRCVNTSHNPTIEIDPRTRLCGVCSSFESAFNPVRIAKELEQVRSIASSTTSTYQAMVGMSGGKDSTATAYRLKKLGIRSLGFTFDTGYYPSHIVERARSVAGTIGIDHEVIDIRSYISESSRASYEATAAFFDHPGESDGGGAANLYLRARGHYSVKDQTILPFPRACQLCRKTVIAAYYGEAVRRGVSLIVLGMNEWVGLSQSADGRLQEISGIRKLAPYGASSPVVYVVHLPFLQRVRLSDLKVELQQLAWQPPAGEDFVETNFNSCLFSAAAEWPARKALGFHPDATRLSREITAGFMTKEDALVALSKHRYYPESVRQVLARAGLVEFLSLADSD